MSTYLFSSESVTEGHPDKVSDFISDSILDAYLEKDPTCRVACETLVTTGKVVVAGEISSNVKLDIESIVRKAITEIGYTFGDIGFSADSVEIQNHLHSQSSDIAQGVTLNNDIGAGDQGLMFGYACTETPELMPLCISLSHKLTKELSRLRKSGELPWLRPDGKAQVTIEYQNDVATRIDTVVVSTQHDANIQLEDIQKELKEKLIFKVLPKNLKPEEATLHINPTGQFIIGGPHGDAGLTGRKIIVDTYGGYAPHGGGAFSGKDATKVDRSAAYAARYAAKNVVAAGLADKCQIQLAYAIGVAEPVSMFVDCFGTQKVSLTNLQAAIKETFSFKPKNIIDELKLREPNFRKSTNYGHFGREDSNLSWEKTDKVEELKKQF